MNTASSQAIATDPAYALDMATTFQPDIDLVVSEGIATFGVKGAGKSNVCARLVEQMSRYPLPYVLFDTKGEYTNLKSVSHASAFTIATANACPSGQEIINKRLHVVVDLRSWNTDEGAALAMSQLLNELFSYASAQDDPGKRVPCPCVIDEAQYWLPQTAISYLSKEVAKELRDTWHTLGTRGRSLGLVPSYFTQNISELHKSVMRQCGIYILMRQVLDNDLDRYAEYIRASNAALMKRTVRGFGPGQAVIILPDGSQVKTQFFPRQSTDPSSTPTVRALMQRLRGKQEATAPKSKQMATTIEESIYAALEENSELSPYELVQRFQCSLEVAKEYRTRFFYPDTSLRVLDTKSQGEIRRA